MRKTLLLLLTLFITAPLSCFAAKLPDVIINEICWMGTGVSSNDEWIELYNSTNSEISLDGWKFIARDGTPEISLSKKISAQGFFILERTNDDSVPNIQSDQIYTGALGNKGEFLQLIDDKGNVIDEVDCKDGWLAGDNQTKQTMERIGLDWQTSQNSGGTPKNQNSTDSTEVRPPQEVRPQKVVYPKGIIINEILPSPEGPDAENEYIEIFNQNGFGVDLSNWSLQDTEGRTKTFTFPPDTNIKARGYSVFFRPETKITLNNSGDGVQLLQPNEKMIDEVDYGKASQGESFNRAENGWVWSTNLTPGAKNIVPQEAGHAMSSESSEKKPESFLKPEAQELLGTMPDILPQQSLITRNFFSILLIGLITAFISAILILILKKKLVFKV